MVWPFRRRRSWFEGLFGDLDEEFGRMEEEMARLMEESLKQKPQASTLTRTWRSEGCLSSTSERVRGSPAALVTIALYVFGRESMIVVCE